MRQHKRILMIGTGGTIASEITDAGLTPGFSTEDLLRFVPSLESLCTVDCMQLCSIDSTNMTPDYWLKIAAAIRERYDDYDGFVVCHGTDTMAYTAAALSYLIQNSPKPIVLTGGQKPIHMEVTDSKSNLLDSFGCACDGRIGGVQIVFGGVVISGTRARKTYSKSFSAFSSINYPVLGVVREGKLIPYLIPERDERPTFYDALDQRVALLKLVPGGSVDLLRLLLRENDAVIIESFGVGGLPTEGGYLEAVHAAAQEGKVVVMTTQVQNEGSDLGVYQVGHVLKDAPGVLEAYDMTTEAVFAKLMWALARTRQPEELRRLFYTPVAADLLGAEE